MPEVLAIIPARGGSKRIPRKNITLLGGKPLIAYSLEAALAAQNIDRVIVSTECEQIKSVAERYGGEVPFLRSKEFATDESHLSSAMKETISRLREDDYYPDIIVELYPTSPFRPYGMIEELTQLLVDGYKRVSTVKPVSLANTRYYEIGNPHPRACLPPEGLKYTAFKPLGLFIGHNLTVSQSKGHYIHKVTDPIQLIDIDYFDDLKLSEEILRRNLFEAAPQC